MPLESVEQGYFAWLLAETERRLANVGRPGETTGRRQVRQDRRQ